MEKNNNVAADRWWDGGGMKIRTKDEEIAQNKGLPLAGTLYKCQAGRGVAREKHTGGEAARNWREKKTAEIEGERIAKKQRRRAAVCFLPVLVSVFEPV